MFAGFCWGCCWCLVLTNALTKSTPSMPTLTRAIMNVFILTSERVFECSFLQCLSLDESIEVIKARLKCEAGDD